jgi:hypothetical protein
MYKKRGRPKKYASDGNRPPKDRPKEGYTRATFIVREDLLKKLKALAYWERKEIKEVVEEAISTRIGDKRIRDIPSKEQRPYKGS